MRLQKNINESKMESINNFEETLDYEFEAPNIHEEKTGKENLEVQKIHEKKSVKEIKNLKRDKKVVEEIMKTLDNVKLKQEKKKEELSLKLLSQGSYAYGLVHRPSRSYNRSRQYSSPYSWSAKK